MTKPGKKKAKHRCIRRDDAVKKSESNEKKPERMEISLDELKAIVSRVQGLSAEEISKLDAAVDTLGVMTRELEMKGASIHRLRRLIFGPSTEKTSRVLGETDKEEKKNKDDDSRESSSSPSNEGENATTTDESPKETGEETVAAEGSSESGKKKRKGHGRNGAEKYTGAERIKISHDTLKHGDVCPECLKGKVYKQKEPSCLVRVTGVAPLYAKVYEMERLRCNLCGEVFTATAPEGVGKEKYDIRAAAMIAMLKYGCGFPFNRLERLERDLGIPLPASTQWEVVEPSAGTLAPVYTEMIRQAAQGDVLHNDDTTVRILELEGVNQGRYLLGEEDSDDVPGPNRTGLYTSGIVSVKGDKQIAAFFTGRKHAGENLKDVLKKRAEELGAPIQMSDGLSRNLPKDIETIRAECNTHARRKFVDEVKSFPEEVAYVLKAYKQVYANDEETKVQGMNDEERFHYHQTHSGPVMEALEIWCRKQLDEHKAEDNGGLGDAINYMLKHWDNLTRFLTVPGVPLDNNLCERVLKKAIIHRKASLFFKTATGAHVGDLYMTLIHTAELAKANVFDYLVTLLEHPQEIAENPADFLPWNYLETIKRLRAETNADNQLPR